MTHIIERANEGEVVLDNRPYILTGEVEETIVNIHGRKVQQGTPRPDDHPTNTSWIQEDWTGGGQKYELDPVADINRFWWSTADTETVNAITLSRLPYQYDIAGDVVWIHGDHNGFLYASGDAALKRYNAGTDAFVAVGAMTSTPVGKGATFRLQTGANKGQVWLFIPLGGSHDYLDHLGAVNNAAGEAAIDFEEWAGKLFKLSTDGLIEFTTDGTTWQSIGTDGTRIPDSSTPRKLVTYFDRQGAPTLVVVSSRGIYFLDFDNATMYTAFNFPKHPFQGKGASEWRGDLYISVGIGVHSYNGGLVAARGLDRGQSLPDEFKGHIVDMSGSYNALYALIQGQSVGSVSEETDVLQLGMGDGAVYVSNVTSNNLLMKWNGGGWHYVWHGTGGLPTNVTVSEAEGMYRLWWGADGIAYAIDLPISYFNPLEIDPPDRFNPSSEHETGWYHWGWLGSDKIAKAIEIHCPIATDTETVEVYYKLDDEDNPWVLALTVTEKGEHHIRLGPDPDGILMPDGSPVYRGAPHERIRLKFRLTRGTDVHAHSVISWHAVICRHWLRPIRQWRFRIDVGATYRGYPARQVKEDLTTLASTKRAITFVHGDDTYLVDLVAVTGPEEAAGKQVMMGKQISLSESFEMV